MLACADLEPGRAIYRAVSALESERLHSASFTPGFSAADFPECGPVVFAYGSTDAAAQEILVAKAPGPMIHDPTEFAWTRLAKGLRLRPQGPVFSP